VGHIKGGPGHIRGRVGCVRKGWGAYGKGIGHVEEGQDMWGGVPGMWLEPGMVRWALGAWYA